MASDGSAPLPPTYIPTPPSPFRPQSPRQEPSKEAIGVYIAKVCKDLWTLFEFLPRTPRGHSKAYREWGFKGAVELQDYKPGGFLNHLLSCVKILYHFNGTTWNPSILVTRDGDESVLRMLDHSIRYHLKEIQDKNLTSEVSPVIQESFDKWSAYVLSWLDENQMLLQRLHTQFEENWERERKERAVKWKNKHGRNTACLPQLLDELRAYA
jgi:hypothetical protein